MVRAMSGAKLMEKKRTEKVRNGDFGIEGNSGSDGKSEWSEIITPVGKLLFAKRCYKS